MIETSVMANIGPQRNVNSSPLLPECCLIFARCFLVNIPHLLIYPHCWTLSLLWEFCCYNSTIVIFVYLGFFRTLNDFLIALCSLNVTEIVKLKSISHQLHCFKAVLIMKLILLIFLSYISFYDIGEKTANSHLK